MGEFSFNLENMSRKRRLQALAAHEAIQGLKSVVRVDLAPDLPKPVEYLANIVEIDLYRCAAPESPDAA